MTPIPALAPPVFHHVGVQTADLENALAWYVDFFGCEPTWMLTSFSPLTISRLPGIGTLVELVVGCVRFHLFDRQEAVSEPSHATVPQYQHLCFQVRSPDELRRWRRHWQELHRSARYIFVLDEQPTEVVVDANGIECFYCRDVNGLEFEFTYTPETAQ
ncbi:VOC family protein [Nocardia arthritidis]|uniref:VOC family protein n=1 Tax=Nocardia arthritidis TaxID=228602 RepID=A0A6G9Y9G5_9NOCA|nr:VOC family protein [Nocardia arthritidis]QIS09869.1 VOC family protein [Nocardia arthritidis]